MATRDELVVALQDGYVSSNRKERGRILDEFAAVSGLHRKHAMRLLRAGRPGRRSGPRPARRLYNDAVREALIVIWEASDRICGKRLRPLVPILVEAMERHGHLQLAPEVRTGLLAMSAATIDRALREVREPGGGRKRRHAPPSAAIRRSVAVRTFDGWDNPPPGFVEADLVAHSGPDGERQLRANTDADGHRDGLDGVRAAAGARAEAADRGIERDAAIGCRSRCSGSTRTTTACS